MSAPIKTNSAHASKVKPTRSLREKVLSKSAKSVASESLAQPSQTCTADPKPKAASVSDAADQRTAVLQQLKSPVTAYSSACSEASDQKRMSENKRVSEIVIEWEQCNVSPPKPIITDEVDSDASSRTDYTSGRRASILYRTPRRGTGVHMDLATREANTLLQQGKEALEAAGNMKRECKVTAQESLQGLYETVLSLSDSRARYKHSLEKERSRHAQELVRAERAHTRDMLALKETLATELCGAREDIRDTLKATKNIREWLGSETLEALKASAETKKGVQALEATIRKEAESTRKEIARGSGSPGKDIPNPILMRLELNIANITNQLDTLRKQLDRLKQTPKSSATSSAQPIQHECCITPAMVTAASTMERLEAQVLKLTTQLTTHINKPPPPQQDISRHFKPLKEKLQSVSSDIRDLRDRPAPTPAAPNLQSELAIVEVKRTLAEVVKGIGKMSDRTPAPQQPKAAAKPTVQPQSGHTLIVSSTDPKHTGDNVMDKLRVALDLKNSGANINKTRKAKNQKVILSCATREDMDVVKRQIIGKDDLKVQEPKPGNPLVCLRGVEAYQTDAEMESLLWSQNRKILHGIEPGSQTLKLKFRKRARDPVICHPVFKLSPELWKRFTQGKAKVFCGLKGPSL
ncbi:uncharacterized protein LOC113508251 [Trichoplusia ni]|uniref:Uncharacterized protein LOC113508251 n=1 Tax=Trichoplusia ni TaxID=7111 RepID=A0A7E5X1G0_TRINI|nr:uncharacterized protein LOC113508251 [Trichoplusia ni]